jgi:hypothetical protein
VNIPAIPHMTLPYSVMGKFGYLPLEESGLYIIPRLSRSILNKFNWFSGSDFIFNGRDF